MAVREVKKLRDAGVEVDHRQRGVRRIDYEVVCNSRMGEAAMRPEAEDVVAAFPNRQDGRPNVNLPGPGSPYDFGGSESEANCFYRMANWSIDERAAEGTRAKVQVTFTPLEPGETPKDRTELDPLKIGARFHWEQESYQRPVDKDATGNPVVNACNTSFDRPIVIEEQRGVQIARFNVASQDAAISLIRNYSSAVNADPWTYWSSEAGVNAARTVCVRYVRSGETHHEGSVAYVPMEMALVYAPVGGNWDESILNEGYDHYEEAADQTYGYAFADDDYAAAQSPVGLTGAVMLKDSTTSQAPADALPTSVGSAGRDLNSGEQVPLLWDGSNWIIAEPEVAMVDGSPKTTDHTLDDGTSSKTLVLLRVNGGRLPRGMIGNFINVRARREVDFSPTLDDLMTPPDP